MPGRIGTGHTGTEGTGTGEIGVRVAGTGKGMGRPDTAGVRLGGRTGGNATGTKGLMATDPAGTRLISSYRTRPMDLNNEDFNNTICSL